MNKIIPAFFALLAVSACAETGADRSAGPAGMQLAGPSVSAKSGTERDKIREAFFDRRDYPATIRIATEYLAKISGDDGNARRARSAYLTLRGAARFHLGQDRAALDDIAAALRHDQNLGMTHYYLGLLADVYKRHEAAVTAYSRAIAINPDDLSSFYRRGVARALLRDFSGAIADLTHVIERRPNSATAFIVRGIVHEEIGARGAALADYRRALAIDPGDDEARAGFGRLAAGSRPSQPPAIRRAPDRDEPPVVQI